MLFQTDDLIREARIRLGINAEAAPPMFRDRTQTTVDDVLRAYIVECVAQAHLEAPALHLEQGHAFGDAVHWCSQDPDHPQYGCGWVLLPDDFMRLLCFKMDDWHTAVTSAITDQDAEYCLQKSEFKGIRGNPWKPVCAVVQRPEGLVLEFYSCHNTAAQASQAMYLPKPLIDEHGAIDISKLCFPRVLELLTDKIRLNK